MAKFGYKRLLFQVLTLSDSIAEHYKHREISDVCKGFKDILQAEEYDIETLTEVSIVLTEVNQKKDSSLTAKQAYEILFPLFQQLVYFSSSKQLELAAYRKDTEAVFTKFCEEQRPYLYLIFIILGSILVLTGTIIYVYTKCDFGQITAQDGSLIQNSFLVHLYKMLVILPVILIDIWLFFQFERVLRHYFHYQHLLNILGISRFIMPIIKEDKEAVQSYLEKLTQKEHESGHLSELVIKEFSSIVKTVLPSKK